MCFQLKGLWKELTCVLLGVSNKHQIRVFLIPLLVRVLALYRYKSWLTSGAGEMIFILFVKTFENDPMVQWVSSLVSWRFESGLDLHRWRCVRWHLFYLFMRSFFAMVEAENHVRARFGCSIFAVRKIVNGILTPAGFLHWAVGPSGFGIFRSGVNVPL